MPAPRKTLQAESQSTDMVIQSQSTDIQLTDIERDTYIQRGDFSGLSEAVRTALCVYVATLAGLDPRMGYVTCINLQGKMVPYIRAAGIAEIARHKVKSLRVSKPEFIFQGNRPLACSVVASVETNDGKTFEDIGCVDCTGQTAFDVMKASTRARSRALKLAVGVHLLSEDEVSEQRQVKKEQGNQ